MIHPEARQRIRDARNAAGISLRELGRRIGVSASLLSQIENGRSDPSVSSLYALVSELGLSLDSLFQESGSATDDPPQRPTGDGGRGHDGTAVRGAGPIVRPGDRRVLEMDSGVRWEQLTRGPSEYIDALLVTYYPGGSSSSSGKLMTHTGVEYAYLFEGELTLRLGFDEYVIKAGDSLMFESSSPHLYANMGDVPARGIWYVVGRDMSPSSEGFAQLVRDLKGERSLSSAVDVLEAFDAPEGESS